MAALIVGAVLVLAACAAPDGGILILENPDGAGFSMEFSKYDGENKCELSLQKNDEVQVEITCDKGSFTFTITGKNGSEPYAGNISESGTFTVTVSEADTYVFWIAGKSATGKIAVRKLDDK